MQRQVAAVLLEGGGETLGGVWNRFSKHRAFLNEVAFNCCGRQDNGRSLLVSISGMLGQYN